MSTIKIIEILMIVVCIGVIVWGVRARKAFYVIAAAIIALTIVIDLAA